ncbi:MAG: co-chaperone GroES family protein [Bacteroidales bacterium]|nr:co-chaperone GroES family protein [Bacteroidales bacterium]MDD3892372.1 co-chaperone GroES family protein [Bacteroidales bacterium]
MALALDTKNLEKLIVVGDRVLIKPKNPEERTKTGLLLPPGVQEKQKVQCGYVIKVGPGYPIPIAGEDNEPWQKRKDNSKYFPLQAQVGDLAVYLQDSGTEIEFSTEKYVVVPFQAILLLVRDEGLFE